MTALVTVVTALLTLGAGLPGAPAAGRPIVHALLKGPASEICVLDPDTLDRRCLTDNRLYEFEPDWSPDGSRIAFVRHLEPRNPDVWVMDADGGNKVRLTTGPRDDDTPEWSPDGTEIVWWKNRGDNPIGHVRIMSADGSNKRTIAGPEGNDRAPRWSPDGTQIAFMSRHRCSECSDATRWAIHVIEADGTNERKLGSDVRADDLWPEWSPDGDSILFSRQDENGTDIYEVDVGSGEERRLTPLDDYHRFLPAYSHDASMLAYTVIVHEENFETRLGVLDLATGEERLVTDRELGGLEPLWAEDSQQIVFVGFHGGQYEVNMIDADGSDLRRLTRTPGSESSLDWF